MLSKSGAENFFTRRLGQFLPHLSVDCVVFGFHDGDLKLLLMKWKHLNRWSLPGGYVGRRQSLDDAAQACLRERTGLGQIHLRQFGAFGSLGRKEGAARALYDSLGIRAPRNAWPLHRVVSIGYYALVDFSKVRPRADYLSDACTWYPLRDRPPLAFDHDAVVDAALEALRASLDRPSAGATLMPASFTMPELQRLHEAVLGRPLDRRNFQKRMLERGGLERLEERRVGAAHRAPFLYRFRPHRARAPF